MIRINLLPVKVSRRQEAVRNELILAGGIAGVLLGIGISQLLSQLNGWPVLVSTNSIVLAVGFSAFIGVAFGFYPAHKAAQLDPIEALRFE